MTRHFVPAAHDKTLIDQITHLRRTDLEIADAMGFSESTIRVHRTRLGLPANARPKKVNFTHEEPRSAPKERPNPVEVAKFTLGRRLVEKPSGYWLDGVPVNIDAMIVAANRVRKADGRKQIAGRDAWLVPE